MESIPYTYEDDTINKAIIEEYEKVPSKWKGRHLILLSYYYFLENQLSKVESLYTMYLLENPEDTDINRNLGTIYAAQKKFDKAEQQYKKVWKYGDFEGLLHLTTLYVQRLQFTKMTPYIDTLYGYKDDPKYNNDPENNDINAFLLLYSLKISPKDKGIIYKAC